MKDLKNWRNLIDRSDDIEAGRSALLRLVFPDQEELGVGHPPVLVHVQLRDALPGLLHLQSRRSSKNLLLLEENLITSEEERLDE